MKVRRLPSAIWPGAPLFPAIRGIKQEIVEPKKVVCEDSSKETVTSPLYLGSGSKRMSSNDTHLSACDYNASAAKPSSQTHTSTAMRETIHCLAILCRKPPLSTRRRPRCSNLTERLRHSCPTGIRSSKPLRSRYSRRTKKGGNLGSVSSYLRRITPMPSTNALSTIIDRRASLGEEGGRRGTHRRQ
nr:hypothetical protein Iba_chr11bCG13800 [Ipomoea batatas]